ncbi:Smr/MutS family protein [Leptobacterium sp. I13]|uniref:Smr/MutS family protein n=1 Tax=Leptobacterium meishanense TaxID=3128904 RepID=UPI0030EDCF0F
MSNLYHIGDLVEVIDEAIRGKIMEINGKELTIDTEEGLELKIAKSDVIKIEQIEALQVTFHEVIEQVALKEQSEKKKVFGKPKKHRSLPPMEVDLHIHQLVPNTKGMTSHDMLTIQIETAKRQLDFAIKKRIPKVVFIHGVGEGVLKMELITLFGRYDNVEFYDADFKKYGFGATKVRIYQNI